MTPPNVSLEHLQDIVEPSRVSWWPLAVGWWCVIAIAVVASTAVGIVCYRKWKSQAYRRAALRELESAASVSAVDAILKRTALCVFPREEVASLSGGRWCQWLSDTVGSEIPDSAAGALKRAFAAHSPDLLSVKQFAKQWIENHSVPPG